jgi:aspartyl/asparaginyl-tRNA synthetase
MAKYTPQGIPVTRVEKMLRDTIKECDEDRVMALEFLDELRERIKNNPDDSQTRVIITRALDLVQSAKNHKTKALDTLTKIKLKEIDIQSKDQSEDRDNPKSFEDYLND